MAELSSTKHSTIKRIFITGLLIILPLTLTLLIFYKLFQSTDDLLSPLLEKFFILLNIPHPPEFFFPILDICAVVVFIFLVGLFATNYVGRKLVSLGERLLGLIPFVRGIYNGLKRITEAFALSGSETFREVVLIEFPRQGIYSIGFITNKAPAAVSEHLDQELISVFLPTTPNPTSGYLLVVPKKDAIPLKMSIEEAVKFIVSGGIVIPESSKEKNLKAETISIPPNQTNYPNPNKTN